MGLRQKLRQLNQRETLWRRDDRLLLAVSGGVDSMVLLTLFEQLPLEERPFFAVAHVNHQVRAASATEEQFLESYCTERGIPFHLYRWEGSQQVTGNFEARAREQRYAFFTEICQAHDYQAVVTAHHVDDQGETFILKLLRGTQLKDLASMQAKSERRDLVIYRPLLDVTKADVTSFATEDHVHFFEDETNHTLTHQRNRVRHEIIPRLQGENDNFLQHIHNLVKQIEYANDIIAGAIDPLVGKMTQQLKADVWQIDLTQFNEVSVSQQYMILVFFFQTVLIEEKVPLQEQHLRDTLDLFTSQKAHGVLHLPQGWEINKSYQWAYLQKQPGELEPTPAKSFQLSVGQGVFVSENEWFGLVAIDQELDIPELATDWQQTELLLKADVSHFPLMIRPGLPKERIVINAKGQTKELRRVLIDEKVPQNLRKKIWVVASPRDLLWIVPIRKSYLSIRKETDKIHYRLIYLKGK